MIQRHFGALPLAYSAIDTVQTLLMPGELLVVMETTPTGGYIFIFLIVFWLLSDMYRQVHRWCRKKST